MKIVIVGPSGVGKTTIIKAFLIRNPNFTQFLTYTTRTKRSESESDYHYITEKEFRIRKQQNFFLETENFFHAMYGTPSILAKSTNIILSMDINGALNLKKVIKDMLLIFILPVNIEFIRNNLQNRGETNINNRMNRINHEISLASECNHIIINDILQNTIQALESIVQIEENNIMARNKILELQENS